MRKIDELVACGRAIPPGFLKKLTEDQRSFILSRVGMRFYWQYLTEHGKHTFIFGTTGGGKTQKGYAFVDWLKYLETQIWFDTGKTNEILPLLCMGKKVRIIVPIGHSLTIEERTDGKWQPIPNHPEVLPVATPYDALSSIGTGSWDKARHPVRDTITIISVRNAFRNKANAVSWVVDFYEQLAIRCRENTMPNIFPASLHLDESQWAMAGKRISGEGDRTKAAEIITENALELRSAGIRLVLYAQDYNNIPPAARENMLFNVLCKGANVKSDENGNLSKWCNFAQGSMAINPMQFSPKQGRFVFENGDSYPVRTPWNFKLYPINEQDREWIRHLRIRYEGKNDMRSEESEGQEECFPELGRFSAMVIPPEKQDCVIGRFNIPETGGLDD